MQSGRARIGDYCIEETSDFIVLKQAFELRLTTWKTEGYQPEGSTAVEWSDDWDKRARHWIARAGNERIVAAARMTFHESLSNLPDRITFIPERLGGCVLPFVILSRLVVSPDHRRHGLCKLLDRIRIDAAIEMGAKTALGSVRQNLLREAMLRKGGWKDVYELGHSMLGQHVPCVVLALDLANVNRGLL